MPKVSLREASIENEDRIADMCASCKAPADDHHAPYCRDCGDYWNDVANGLFDDLEEF